MQFLLFEDFIISNAIKNREYTILSIFIFYDTL